MEQNAAISSLEQFARNVTEYEGLSSHLLDAARHLQGANASEEALRKQATRLLLDAMDQVGIDPGIETNRRERLYRWLRGDEVVPEEIHRNVNYALSQMIIQPKGALAEVLAILPCALQPAFELSGCFRPSASRSTPNEGRVATPLGGTHARWSTVFC